MLHLVTFSLSFIFMMILIMMHVSLRTLEYLIKHLARLATFSEETNMHIKNLAIVWAPNLLR